MKAYLLIRTSIILSALVFSVPSYSLSCKCNCRLMDKGLCASGYDIDKPCRGLCSGQTPGLGPMITACPMVEVAHPWTGVKQWIAVCIDYDR